MKCKDCGTEWFVIERQVKIGPLVTLDTEPLPMESRVRVVCAGCGVEQEPEAPVER